MSFAIRAGLLCALLAATLGATGNGLDAARLLERMRAAAGPVWDAHVVSVSRLASSGESAVVSSDNEGLRLAVRRCTGELCDGEYFDGERLYSVNINGTALPASPRSEPYLRALRLVASLGFLSPGFPARGGRIGESGSRTYGGKTYDTIVVADAASVPLRLYVDPASALVRAARTLDGGDTFEYRDYRRVGAFTLPFEVLHDGAIYERYDDRAPVASAFHPPHGPLPVFNGAPAQIATDPAAVTPIVDCELAGVPVRCLLDTGNSGLSISSELASRLGVPVVGSYRVRGLGGYATQVVRVGSLRVGNAAYPEAYYVVLNDLRRYGYDVVLGADIFASTAVEIDAAHHLVRLGSTPDAGAIDLPLSFENFVPVVGVSLAGVPAQLAVDTGDESNVNLGHDFYAKHSELFAVTTRRLVSGIGGNSVEAIGEIPQVGIGAYRTGPQRIGTTQTLAGTASGHLGAAFLDQFVAWFDYAAGRLHLLPRRA